MTILISNGSVQCVARSYAHTRDGLLVWLELAPHHPKVVGAIRAELTSNARRYLQLRDEARSHFKTVYGLGRGYLNLTADAPQLAVGHQAKAQLLRLIAPQAVDPEDFSQPFYALAWPGIDPATALAAALERHAPYPVLTGWGPYLLAQALHDHKAEALLSGGQAPIGYAIQSDTPWMDLICQGLHQGEITLDGKIIRQPEVILEPVN